MIVREQIKKLITQAIKRAQKDKDLPVFKMPKINIERILPETFGDYAANSAVAIAGITQMPPTKVTEILNKKLEIIADEVMEPTEFIAPVFQNIKLKKEFLQKQVAQILEQGKDYGGGAPKNQKIQVEFISANPTGPLTVGNARGGPFGDCLANVLQKAGCEVKKAYYVNDVGQQILKLGHSVLKDKEAVYQGEYIEKLNQQIKDKDKDPLIVGQKAAKIILDDYIKTVLQKAGIQFDQWYFESELYQSAAVEAIIKDLKKKEVLYEKDGATWFRSSRFGDKRDRVLIKTDGQKTYLAGDLALHQAKLNQGKFDRLINIWGADHAGDVAGLQAGLEALGYKDKLKIILLQFVTLLERGERKKMSKRSGILVTLDELLKKVGPDVMRFFFLQKSANTHLNFDLDLACEQSEKNPVFYVQYAYARICSILRKSKIKTDGKTVILRTLSEAKRTKDPGVKQEAPTEFLNHNSELDLMRQLIRLPEIIEDTARDYQLQRLPTYSLELAAAFHRFYKNCRVLGNQDKNLDEARLALISATKNVLKNTLDLMGISAPEKM